MKEEPRLLKTEEKVKKEGGSEENVDCVTTQLPGTPITNYAWADEDMKVKIYIELPNVGELPKESIDLKWTKTSFNLTIINYEEKGNLKLSFNKLFDEAENIIAKKLKNKVVVTINKVEDKSWPCINAGTPSK